MDRPANFKAVNTMMNKPLDEYDTVKNILIKHNVLNKEIEDLIPKSIKFTSASGDLYLQYESFIKNIFQKGIS